MKARRVVLLLAIGASVCGCAATLGELRQSAPNRVGQATGDYQVLAGCVIEGLQTSADGSMSGRVLYQTVTRPDEKRMMVTGVLWSASATPMPVIDLAFRQARAGEVTIESRLGGAPTARGETEKIDRTVWSIAQQCTGGRVEVAPPVVP